MSVDERWVDIEEVAKHLGFNTDSVHRRIEEQPTPAHRVGRLYRFKLELDAWVVKGCGDKRGQAATEEGEVNRAPIRLVSKRRPR